MKTAAEILCDLISIRTDPEVKTNQEMVDYVTSCLAENGAEFALVPTGQSNNIVAGINVDSLNNIDDGIVLAGHMDTVGCELQNWKTNPFQGTQQDGKIFGRGAMDMKHFIAVVLSLLPQLKKLPFPVLFAFSCDEETEVLGVQDIVAFFKKQNIHPKYVLIGEATDFKLAVSNRGYIGYQTYVQGIAGHAGNPELGTNAIYIASQIISRIEELNQKYAKQGTTLNVGKIEGGSGRNSIPATVFFDWEIRYQQDVMKGKMLAELEDFYQKLQIKYPDAVVTNETKESLPAFEKQESILCQTAESILKTEKIVFPYASEAGFFQSCGMDVLICGAGDFNVAHTADEYVLISDVERYRDFVLNLLENLK